MIQANHILNSKSIFWIRKINGTISAMNCFLYILHKIQAAKTFLNVVVC